MKHDIIEVSQQHTNAIELSHPTGEHKVAFNPPLIIIINSLQSGARIAENENKNSNT